MLDLIVEVDLIVDVTDVVEAALVVDVAVAVPCVTYRCPFRKPFCSHDSTHAQACVSGLRTSTAVDKVAGTEVTHVPATLPPFVKAPVKPTSQQKPLP